MKLDKDKVLGQLNTVKSPFVVLFEHGSLSVEVYQPKLIDLQKPHSRDEVYVIIAGHGEFVIRDKRTTFKAGDFLFVPAGADHRFENFTEDFVTWVLFYGPEGGEVPESFTH